jgi:hypothetical protein
MSSNTPKRRSERINPASAGQLAAHGGEDSRQSYPRVDDIVGMLEGGPDSVTWLRIQRTPRTPDGNV